MTLRLFHTTTATACLLILLCQHLCPGTVCAAEISQEEIDSRLERLAKELLADVKPNEFVSDFDRLEMHYELAETLLKNRQFQLAGTVLAQIYEEQQFALPGITYAEASRQLLQQYYSRSAILEYLKVRERKLDSQTEPQLSLAEQRQREFTVERLDWIRTFLIDSYFIDSQFEAAIEQIGLLHQPDNQIEYWLQLIPLERKAGAGDVVAKHLNQVENLLDTFIRSEWKEYLITDEDAPKDIQVPIVKIWETSNVPQPILDRLPHMHPRLNAWLHRLGVEIDAVGGIASAEYLKELVDEKSLTDPNYFSSEIARKVVSNVLESSYESAKLFFFRGRYDSFREEVTRALIARDKLIHAEEFLRLVEDWDGLRLLAEEYARRGDVTKVRQLAEALRANGQLPGNFVPETAIHLLHQGKLAQATQYLKEEWEQWPRDFARWEKSNREGNDWSIDNPNQRIEIECLFMKAFQKTGDYQTAFDQLKQLQKYVQAIPPDAVYSPVPNLRGVHLRSDACSKLGKAAAFLGPRPIAKELFTESLSFEQGNRDEILLDMAAAGFLKDFQSEVDKIHTVIEPFDDPERMEEFYESIRRRLKQDGFRAYYKSKAELDPENVNFNAIQKYENQKNRFYAELGLLEGLLSARN